MEESAEVQSDTTTVFDVEAKPLHSVGDSSIHHCKPQKKRLLHTSWAECAIYFWWKSQLVGEMLGFVDYMGVKDVTSAHPWTTNLVSNVPWISADEIFIGTI